MITADIEANSFEDYYNKLYALQAKAHEESYLLVHHEIRKHMKKCSSYTELGIKQGATLAAALLEKPLITRAYDIDLSWYEKARHFFDQYTTEHNIDHKVFAKDTLTFTIDETDLLYIDTMHNYDQVTGELRQHAHKVRKYIVFHDTQIPGVRKAVKEFVANDSKWKIVTNCQINVGFLTIRKL